MRELLVPTCEIYWALKKWKATFRLINIDQLSSTKFQITEASTCWYRQLCGVTMRAGSSNSRPEFERCEHGRTENDGPTWNATETEEEAEAEIGNRRIG